MEQQERGLGWKQIWKERVYLRVGQGNNSAQKLRQSMKDKKSGKKKISRKKSSANNTTPPAPRNGEKTVTITAAEYAEMQKKENMG